MATRIFPSPTEVLQQLHSLKPFCAVSFQPIHFCYQSQGEAFLNAMRTLETSNNSYVSQIKNLHIPTTMNAALPLPFAANGSSYSNTYMQNISGGSTTSIDTTDASVADISTSMCHDEYLRAMVYPACGHVFGFNSRLQETSRCPLCRTKSKLIPVTFPFQPYIDCGKPTHVFNPCGHVASLEVCKYWSGQSSMTFTTTASNVNADTTTAAAGAGGGGGTAMMGPGPSFTDVTATLLARANDDYPHRRQCFTDGLESEQVAGGERVTQYGPGPWIQSGQLRYRSAVPIPESTPATHNIAANAHSHISSTATATATASTSVTLGTERKVRAYHICPFCGKNLSSTVPYSPLLLQTDAGDSDLWSGPPYKTAENSSIPFSHLPSPPSSSSVASVASVSQQLHSTSTSSSDLVKRAFLPGGALHSYLEGQGQGNEHGMALLRFPKVQRAR